VHRIGRTARADRDGAAVTFVSEKDQFAFRQIEKFLGKEVEKTPLPEGLGEGPAYTQRAKKRSNTRRHGRWHSKGNGSNNQAKPKDSQEGAKKKRHHHRPKPNAQGNQS
jgi:superfamily II DNA/RNA helicase